MPDPQGGSELQKHARNPKIVSWDFFNNPLKEGVKFGALLLWTFQQPPNRGDGASLRTRGPGDSAPGSFPCGLALVGRFVVHHEVETARFLVGVCSQAHDGVHDFEQDEGDSARIDERGDDAHELDPDLAAHADTL